MKLNQIQDIGGVRIICSDIDQFMALLPYLDEILPEYREKNRLENPAPSGYRGIHRIYKTDGVISKIKSYAKTNYLKKGHEQYPDAYYALIERQDGGMTEITYYSEDQVERAFAEYEHNERGEENSDKVLVSINNVKKISEIYPNYFVQLEKIASTLDDLLDYAE